MGAKILQNFLLKLERMEAPTDIPELPQEGGWIGNLMLDDKITSIPVFLPIRRTHTANEGGTGMGKTYAARVFVENMLLDRTNLLVLDRTRQWAGLGLPNKHEHVFDRYDQLGIDTNKARGFKIKLHTAPIPEPGELITGANIVSFKGVTKKEQCKQTAKILKHIYSEYVEHGEETTSIRLLVVLEETVTFLKDKAVRAILDELCREGRKYGIIFLFCTQLPSDFKYDTKSIRENVKNYVYLQLQDGNELSYVKDILGDRVNTVKSLKPGEAIIKTPDLDVVKVFMRPPFSHVGEPTKDELREINGDSDMEIIGYSSAPDVNDTEAKILDFVKEVYQFSNDPVLASDIKDVLELSNSTCNRVLNKMAEKKLIKKKFIRTGTGRSKLGIKLIPGVR